MTTHSLKQSNQETARLTSELLLRLQAGVEHANQQAQKPDEPPAAQPKDGDYEARNSPGGDMRWRAPLLNVDGEILGRANDEGSVPDHVVTESPKDHAKDGGVDASDKRVQPDEGTGRK